MRIPKRNPKHHDAFANRPELTQILHFSPPMPLAAPPNSLNIAGPSTAQKASPKMPTPILRKSQRKEKRKMTISDTSDSDTSSVRKSKRTLKRQKKTSTSVVEKIQNTEGYLADNPESSTAFIGEVSPRNPNERWITDPNPNPRETMVLQAETQEQSDSE